MVEGSASDTIVSRESTKVQRMNFNRLTKQQAAAGSGRGRARATSHRSTQQTGRLAQSFLELGIELLQVYG